MQLEINNLSASYGPRQVLRGISFAVEPGLVIITGRNGVGKSTLLKAIFGLVPGATGSLRLDGMELFGMSPSRLRGIGITYMPQGGQVFAEMTCLENLVLAANSKRINTSVSERIDDLSEAFHHLLPRLGERAGTLSGGERQLLAFWMALMPSPRLLLLDEPLAGLSDGTIGCWLDTLSALVHRENIGCLVVEQRDRVFDGLADQWLQLSNGMVAQLTGRLESD